MDWFLAAIFAGAIAGGIVEKEARKRRGEAEEINGKLDLLLRHVGAADLSPPRQDEP